MSLINIEAEIKLIEKNSFALEWKLYHTSYNTPEFISIREKFDNLNIYLTEVKEKYQLNKSRKEKLDKLNNLV